ncbi:hypothetical protein WN51_05501 [Melipona quadrifasciata]|uniref:Uncharacterized protein n=1 Tax=Melipona quadrifasciata TaxID=166423 RepID=A0A0M9ABU9_9HYME|nr:hypothetical protein WN51_05501 [Melipona quadrifasciata]
MSTTEALLYWKQSLVSRMIPDIDDMPCLERSLRTGGVSKEEAGETNFVQAFSPVDNRSRGIFVDSNTRREEFWYDM